MNTHSFVLQLDRTPAKGGWFDDFIEAAFPAISDSTPYEQGGIAYLHFARESATLRDAVVSAVRGIRQADPSVAVVGIILDDGQPIDQLFVPIEVAAG